MALLELDKLSLDFGGLRALSELDLPVDEGEIVSLIGPNGAGKTTVFNVITGLYEPTGGEVRFDGESLAGLKPHQVTQLGVARTFQSLRLFLNTTVIENVITATYGGTQGDAGRADPPSAARAARGARGARAGASKILSFFGQRLAGYRWNQPAYSLSYANRRRLEIARALATQPALLLLDEPAAGMNPNETHEVTELIGRLRDELGVGILVIEHDMHVVGGRVRPRRRARPRRQDRRGDLRRGGRASGRRRGVPGTRSGGPCRGVRDVMNETMSNDTNGLLKLDQITTYYGQMRILEGISIEVGSRRAGLSAGRERVGEVDHAEDDPRAGAARARAGCCWPARTSPAGRCRSGSPTASRSCPRTAGCSVT